ncbi:pectinesterase inhibitor-like [Cannabis sativa]|uniref:pectinesterase inhibitor-like n=1 Tax=Cannabis sativa TaxID=3483 RepID=UPI0029CAAAEA|nr:pectinesterase inhibitor-like [Cannabis sativa]
MNPISVFCFLTLLSIGLNKIPQVYGDLISDTCGKALYKDVCEKTLRADPNSRGAKVDGLAKIALKAASSSAKTTQGQITSLLKTAKDKAVIAALKDCNENYDGANSQLNDSLKAMVNKRYADVNIWVTAAMTDGDSCEDGFKKGTSPLTQANTNFGQLCSNVLAITNQIK